MNIPPLQRHIEASDIPPERLAGNSQLTEQEKIGEAARQFEAILLRQILQSAHKTVIKSNFSDDSTSSSIYQDLAVNQLADDISKSGTIGLAKTLQHEFTRQLHSGSSSTQQPPTAEPTH
jgi:flagellar protein FlgJ